MERGIVTIRNGGDSCVTGSDGDLGTVRELEEELRVRRMLDAVEPLLRNSALSLPSEHAFLDEVAHLLGNSAGADQVYILLSAQDADAYEEEVRWAREPERSLVPLRMEVIGTRIESGLAKGVVHLSVQPGRDRSADGAEHELLRAIGAAEALAVPFVTIGERRGVLMLTRACGSGSWSVAERTALERLGGLLETLLAWMRAEQRYRSVISSIEDCLVAFSFDADGERKFTFVTHQVERLLSHRADALLQGDVSWLGDIVYADDRPALEAVERRVRQGEEVRLVYRVVSNEGRTRWLRESLSPRQDASGRLVVAGILSDVTDQKEAEAELVRAKQDAETADRLKSAFLATMSHEMRTPLGVIKGFAQLLHDELSAVSGISNEVHEFLDAIESNSVRVLRLVETLLDLARLQTDRLALETAPVAVVPMVREVVSRYEDELRQRGISLVLQGAELEAVVLADRGRLEQIFEAVVANAAKFTVEGSIVVDIVLLPELVAIRVKDSGVGVAEECVGQLFEPFFQEDNSLNRSFQGSGLGLALAKRLVEAMSGTIVLESENGKGTTVRIALPRADE